ncbi:MAG: four helix bundle protein [Hymenobacteraceae bacterium]|nr:four helix bundle protein [Hymenobacteraceae bacterium]
MRTIRLYRELPVAEEARVVGRQLLRSATSTAANHRAVCRARSDAEHFAKLGITIEEDDESALWLEIIVESDLLPAVRVLPLHADFVEITAILAKARKSAS